MKITNDGCNNCSYAVGRREFVQLSEKSNPIRIKILCVCDFDATLTVAAPIYFRLIELEERLYWNHWVPEISTTSYEFKQPVS